MVPEESSQTNTEVLRPAIQRMVTRLIKDMPFLVDIDWQYGTTLDVLLRCTLLHNLHLCEAIPIDYLDKDTFVEFVDVLCEKLIYSATRAMESHLAKEWKHAREGNGWLMILRWSDSIHLVHDAVPRQGMPPETYEIEILESITPLAYQSLEAIPVSVPIQRIRFRLYDINHRLRIAWYRV